MDKLHSGVPLDGIIPNTAVLLARIYTGFTIGGAGFDKLPLPEWMTEQVASLGFPAPHLFAWGASFCEFAFGLLLLLGLMTRLSAMVLAVTMGVAAFAYHGNIPLADMHIAQHFFWLFVLFAVLGGGRFSLDHLITKQAVKWKGWRFAGPGLVLAALAFGLLREMQSPPVIAETQDTFTIESIHVPGTFNDWDPSANTMHERSDGVYQGTITFNNSGLVEFKFTANASWDYNLGEKDQDAAGFPVSGIAELDRGDTDNIRVYVPAPGEYRITLNTENFAYAVDSVTAIDQ